MTSMFEGQPCKGHLGSRRVYIHIYSTEIDTSTIYSNVSLDLG